MKWFIDIWGIVLNTANWSVADVLSLASIVLVVGGGVFAYGQWAASNRIKRTEFINQIIDKLRFDKEMVDTMLLVDYTDEWYDKEFHGGELELKIDKLLSYLSYICYTYKMKNIKKKEFDFLRYELQRACSSTAVQGYLWNIHRFAKSQKTICSFKYLIDYGIRNKLISRKDFDNNDCPKYPKYLIF